MKSGLGKATGSGGYLSASEGDLALENPIRLLDGLPKVFDGYQAILNRLASIDRGSPNARGSKLHELGIYKEKPRSGGAKFGSLRI